MYLTTLLSKFARLSLVLYLVTAQCILPVQAEVTIENTELPKNSEQEDKAVRIRKAYQLSERLADLGEPPSIFDKILTYGGASLGGLMILGSIPLIYDYNANNNPYAALGVGMLLIIGVPILATSAYFIHQNNQYDTRYQAIQNEMKTYGIKRLPPPKKSILSSLSEWSDTKGGILFGLLSLSIFSQMINAYITGRSIPADNLLKVGAFGVGSLAASIYFFTRKSKPKPKFDDESLLSSSWLTPSRIDDDWALSFGFSF